MRNLLNEITKLLTFDFYCKKNVELSDVHSFFLINATLSKRRDVTKERINHKIEFLEHIKYHSSSIINTLLRGPIMKM